MDKPPPLWDRMRALADMPEHAAVADTLRQRADQFEAAAKGFYAESQTVTPAHFLGCFARARRLYCDITGEPLI